MASQGDIIAVGKISYRLYTAATTGGKDAPKDLHELGNALFSLNCALDHLVQAASDILNKAGSQPSIDDAVATKKKLDQMISSCAATLTDLDEATKKHREVDANSQSATSPGMLQRLQKKAKVQWNKMSWDLLGESLGAYRKKLESHTAAINMVLLTFIWCVHPIL